MPPPLPGPARERLVKLLRLLASDHDGERATAAAFASRMVRNAKTDWDAIIVPACAPAPHGFSGASGGAGPGARTWDAAGASPGGEPRPGAGPMAHREVARHVLSAGLALSGKERDFLANIARRSFPPTPKQAAWLNALAHRAAAEGWPR